MKITNKSQKNICMQGGFLPSIFDKDTAMIFIKTKETMKQNNNLFRF